MPKEDPPGIKRLRELERINGTEGMSMLQVQSLTLNEELLAIWERGKMQRLENAGAAFGTALTMQQEGVLALPEGFMLEDRDGVVHVVSKL